MKIALFYDLHHYTIIDDNDRFEKTLDFVGLKKGGRGYSGTDPWMNRYPILKDCGMTYIIIPSKLQHGFDNRISTAERFAILVSCGDRIEDATDELMQNFIEHYPMLFSEEETDRQKQTYEEGMRLASASTEIGIILAALYSLEELEQMKNDSVGASEVLTLSIEKAIVMKEML